ncbi:MAG: hypothetical protein NTZ79_06180 [Proteobacteria bacterium]|nr:hypothetical protein [Pseudomonadota bacterium]
MRTETVTMVHRAITRLTAAIAVSLRRPTGLAAALVAVAAIAAAPSHAGQPGAGAEPVVALVAPSTDAPPAAPRELHAHAGDGLEHRLAVLAKALELDAAQREKLHKILVDQRDAVQKVWHDPKLLPAERAPATRALTERTGDQIRAILTAEQQAKYNPPKPPAPPAPDSGPPDVERWMRATQKK